MPKNFDELKTEDRTFVLGGETFTFQYVQPEVMAAWEDEPDVETAAETLVQADDKIRLFLSHEDGERYLALRSRTEDPITNQQMNAVLRWLVEVQTGRPTETPSPSDSGDGSTEATSTDGSLSRAIRPNRQQRRAAARSR